DLLKDPKTGTQITPLMANVDSAVVRDSLTAVVWFHRRTPQQFYDFTYQTRLLPEHVLKAIPREKLATSEVLRRPIGSGRFRFVRWEPGIRIEIMADTSNFRGRPKLDRVIWSFVPDPSAAIAQLFSGQIDLYE